MGEVAIEGKATGRVVGYVESRDSSSTKIKALIQVGTSIIDVKVEFLQYEYIGKEYPVGSIATVWSRDCEWHFEGRPQRDRSASRFADVLRMAGERTSGVRREILGPTRKELSAEKLSSQVEGDLDYIIKSVGAIDLGTPDETEYIRQVKHEFFNERNRLIEKLNLHSWRTPDMAPSVNS